MAAVFTRQPRSFSTNNSRKTERKRERLRKKKIIDKAGTKHRLTQTHTQGKRERERERKKRNETKEKKFQRKETVNRISHWLQWNGVMVRRSIAARFYHSKTASVKWVGPKEEVAEEEEEEEEEEDDYFVTFQHYYFILLYFSFSLSFLTRLWLCLSAGSFPKYSLCFVCPIRRGSGGRGGRGGRNIQRQNLPPPTSLPPPPPPPPPPHLLSPSPPKKRKERKRRTASSWKTRETIPG